MDKDDILAKSREENKDRDLYTREIEASASTAAAIVSLLLATVFFLLHFFIKKEFNFGLYGILFSFGATTFIIKAVRMRRKPDILLAIVYTIATFALTITYIFQLTAAL